MCTSVEDSSQSLRVLDQGNRRVARERMLVVINPDAGIADRKLTLALLRDQLTVRSNQELLAALREWFPKERQLLADLTIAVETVALKTFFTDRRTADRRA
ncbi:MAG: hypothetical protein G01um101431_512 [Parcubacteria group bacterium Gr01-1014_31]|nr:MAG: hypothetical protein G01um101431_512 [Parcubacteria group bacterium Gr01-1014_31]